VDRLPRSSRIPRQPLATVEALGRAVRIFTSAYAFAVANVSLLAALFMSFGELSAAWVTAGYVLALVVCGLTFLETGWWGPTLAAVWLAGLANHVAVTVLLGGYAQSGAYLLWGVSNTVLASMGLTRLQTGALSAVYVAVAIVFATLEPVLQGSREPPAVALTAILFGHVLITTLASVVPAMVWFAESLAEERQRSERLLLNVLPRSIAARLKRQAGSIADEVAACTVVFADIVGFTRYSAGVTAQQLVAELNRVFSEFDKLVERHGLEKIKTIGDGYMAVAGLPTAAVNHAAVACEFALDMRAAMSRMAAEDGLDLHLRIGLNTGPVVAGIIGHHRFAYDLWGDTVNVASRMESHGVPDGIQVTASVVEGAGRAYVFEPIGCVEVKGKGWLQAWLLTGRRGQRG
jgi:class 3 adenylate cyclase